VFVKKTYLRSWVIIAMQSIHVRVNSSLSPPPLKNRGSAYALAKYLINVNTTVSLRIGEGLWWSPGQPAPKRIFLRLFS